MTQASLSPELGGALPASPASSETDVRSSGAPEGALWMIALTSSGLVVTAVLVLGLMARGTIGDASLGGFVAGIAVMMATVGVGAMGYVLVVAKRQGLLTPAHEAVATPTSVAPSGLHVVPAEPAEVVRRKRLEAESERAARSKQAKAIAAAAASTTQRTAAPRPPSPPQAPARPVPVRQPAGRSAGTPVARAMPARPVPSAPPPARPVGRPPVYPTLQMPRTQATGPRPLAPPRAPAVHMPAPPVMPRTQATLYQVNATNVRSVPPTSHR